MNLQQIKDEMQGIGLSEISLSAINMILDKSIAAGVLSKEDNDRILAIIDVEVELAHIEAAAYDDASVALESYAHELDLASENALEDLESVDKNLSEDLDNMVKQSPSSQPLSQ